jgi:hypothetical protein
MTRQLSDHHDVQDNPCIVCHALVNTIEALRLALHNAQVDRDAAQIEAASLPHPVWTGAL